MAREAGWRCGGKKTALTKGHVLRHGARRAAAGRGSIARTMRPLRLFFTAPALAALLSISSVALAAPSPKDRADARALVAAGKKAMKDKRWAQAVIALKKAEKLDPSPGLALDVAQAQIGAGKLTEASKTLALVAEGTDAAPAAKKAREAAKKALADLKARIPTAKVTVAGPSSAKVTLLVDGVEVDGADEISVNPGDHTVGAAADGFVAAEKDVHFTEGGREEVTLRLKKIAPAGAVAAVEGDGEGKKTGSRTPGAVVTTLGGVGLLVGGIFGGLAFTATASAKAQCTGNVCPQVATDDIARSKTYGNVSTAAFIAGGAVALTGIVLIVAAPGGKSDDASRSARVSPWIGPGGAGVSGSF
jgi:hypothetical protein